MSDEKTIWVCMACGKRSNDLYGRKPIDRGWDESCCLNAVEALESHIVLAGGRVAAIKEGGVAQRPED